MNEEGKDTHILDNFPLIFLLFLLICTSKVLNIFASEIICSYS